MLLFVCFSLINTVNHNFSLCFDFYFFKITFVHISTEHGKCFATIPNIVCINFSQMVPYDLQLDAGIMPQLVITIEGELVPGADRYTRPLILLPV